MLRKIQETGPRYLESRKLNASNKVLLQTVDIKIIDQNLFVGQKFRCLPDDDGV